MNKYVASGLRVVGAVAVIVAAYSYGKSLGTNNGRVSGYQDGTNDVYNSMLECVQSNRAGNLIEFLECTDEVATAKAIMRIVAE